MRDTGHDGLCVDVFVTRVSTKTANSTQTAVASSQFSWASNSTPTVTMYPTASTVNRTITLAGNLV